MWNLRLGICLPLKWLLFVSPPEQGVELNPKDGAENSPFAEIKILQCNMNFDTRYVSLARVFDAQLEMYEIRGRFFIMGVQLRILSRLQSRAFNLLWILRHVSLGQVVAAKL